MGDLDTAHENFLATSLEDPAFFGKPIVFRTRDSSLTIEVNGTINKIMPEMEGHSKPRGCSVLIGVRHSTVLTAAGYPVLGWGDRLPTFGWLVDLVSPWTGALETYTIERGAISEDRSMGLDTIALIEYTE